MSLFYFDLFFFGILNSKFKCLQFLIFVYKLLIATPGVCEPCEPCTPAQEEDCELFEILTYVMSALTGMFLITTIVFFVLWCRARRDDDDDSEVKQIRRAHCLISVGLGAGNRRRRRERGRYGGSFRASRADWKTGSKSKRNARKGRV